MRFRHTESIDRVPLEIELDQHRRFSSDDMPVMAGCNGDNLRRLIDLDTAVLVDHVDPALDKESDVRVHAVVSPHVWFGVDRPFVTRRIDHPFDPPLPCGTPFETDTAHIASSRGAAHVRNGGRP
jgi:hypothetical protein